jgi:hypothetical protein
MISYTPFATDEFVWLNCETKEDARKIVFHLIAREHWFMYKGGSDLTIIVRDYVSLYRLRQRGVKFSVEE